MDTKEVYPRYCDYNDDPRQESPPSQREVTGVFEALPILFRCYFILGAYGMRECKK